MRKPHAIRIWKTLRPGEKGSKGLCKLYGGQLVKVRYCVDWKTKKRFKTVELIVPLRKWKRRKF